MSESGIYSTLSADGDVSGLVNTRIYPVIAPQEVTTPYIVYRRITGISKNDLNGELGLSDARFQIDVYSSTYAVSKTLAGYVKTAMKNSNMDSRLLTDQDFEYEIETDLYRVSMDFKIWVAE